VTHQVQIQVTRFDSDSSGGARLNTNWAVYRVAGSAPALRHQSHIAIPGYSPGDHAAMTESLSRAVNQLAREIMEQIKQHPG